MEPTWTVISIPGAVIEYAAYNRDTRKSSRLFKTRTAANKEVTRRNRREQQRAAKAERVKARKQLKRESAKLATDWLKPYIRAIRQCDVAAIGVLADQLEECGDKRALAVRQVYVDATGNVAEKLARTTGSYEIPITSAGRAALVATDLRCAAVNCLHEIGVLERTAYQNCRTNKEWETRTAIRKRSIIVARRMVREHEKRKSVPQ